MMGKDRELFTSVRDLAKKVKMNTNGGSAKIGKVAGEVMGEHITCPTP